LVFYTDIGALTGRHRRGPRCREPGERIRSTWVRWRPVISSGVAAGGFILGNRTPATLYWHETPHPRIFLTPRTFGTISGINTAVKGRGKRCG